MSPVLRIEMYLLSTSRPLEQQELKSSNIGFRELDKLWRRQAAVVEVDIAVATVVVVKSSLGNKLIEDFVDVADEWEH
jgi:hypothetical protein